MKPTEFRVPLDDEAFGASKASKASRIPAIPACVYHANPDLNNPSPAFAATFVFAHGAGAGQHSPFVLEFAHGLARLGIDVVTFDFPYMAEQRKMPDRAPVLEACYRSVVAATRDVVDSSKQHTFIGGKSMGGRMATHIAAADPELPVDGLVLIGYPLHPPAKPLELRAAHLPRVKRPMLFVQGSRDPFGHPSELAAVLGDVTPAPTIHEIAGGDHSLKISRRDAAAQAAVYADAQRSIVSWMAVRTR